MKNLITYFVSPCKETGYSVEITTAKNKEENRLLHSRWPADFKGDTTREAIGKAILCALSSKNDYGNNVRVVIELNVCSVLDPVINL